MCSEGLAIMACCTHRLERANLKRLHHVLERADRLLPQSRHELRAHHQNTRHVLERAQRNKNCSLKGSIMCSKGLIITRTSHGRNRHVLERAHRLFLVASIRHVLERAHPNKICSSCARKGSCSQCQIMGLQGPVNDF